MASDDGRYRGLLIDWGGVLTTDVFASFQSFCALEGLAPDALQRRFREDRDCRELVVSLETGVIDEEQFELRFAGLLGVGAPDLLDRMFAESLPDERMLDLVRRARAAGVRTGLVSNSWGTGRYPRELLVELFDGVVISGDVGLRKPGPEIYRLGAERIGLPPNACVFVDDLPFNLSPAAELGMATIHHRTAEATAGELERLLGVNLR